MSTTIPVVTCTPGVIGQYTKWWTAILEEYGVRCVMSETVDGATYAFDEWGLLKFTIKPNGILTRLYYHVGDIVKSADFISKEKALEYALCKLNLLN